MSETDRDWTLKEMCAAFDVTPRTLRYYEYIELLSPARSGRTRYYSARERARLTLILRGRRFGFALEQIRQWLNLYDEGPDAQPQIREWIDLSNGQIAQLESQRQELDATIDELRRLRDWGVAQLEKSHETVTGGK
ncbi:MAG: MerR family DNA-binding transcriptional regulator [Pseudomonadota bacterium]